MSVLSKPYFHDEAKAFDYLESVLWPEGPVCPHCGSISGKHYDLRKTRMGLRKCSDCRKQFTVKVGTVFESGHIPLNKMLQAVYLMTSSKKGISAHQLHRVLEITYKSAWFLAHRIREAMRNNSLSPLGVGGHRRNRRDDFWSCRRCPAARRSRAVALAPSRCVLLWLSVVALLAASMLKVRRSRSWRRLSGPTSRAKPRS